MTDVIPDLWPLDLSTTQEPSPVGVLRQQAYLLGQRTQNFVVGEVVSSGKGSEFHHEFFITAPVLNYRQKLLELDLRIKSYPLEVKLFSTSDSTQIEEQLKANNPSEFLKVLTHVFSRADVVELIRSLIGQSRSTVE